MATRRKKLAGRIIAIAGGKGGVGKSLITANLAVTMARTGRRVVVVDTDLGAANLHTLFGISRPSPGIQALLDNQVDSLEQAAMPTVAPNVSLIAGTASVGSANINHGQKQRILRHLCTLDADVVIVDIGAGTSFNALDFFDVADLRVVVMTPQLTSLQNAYAFLKSSVHRILHHVADSADERRRVAAITARVGEMESTSRLLERLRDEEPDFASRAEAALAHFGSVLIGNLVYSEREVAGLYAMGRMVRDFLGIQIPIAGVVSHSEQLRKSVNRRRPLLLEPGNHRGVSAAFRKISQHLLSADVASLRDGRNSAGLYTPSVSEWEEKQVEIDISRLNLS